MIRSLPVAVSVARGVAVAVLFALSSVPVLAATSSDPDWPCVQRRQPELSLAQVWSGPSPDAATQELARSAEVSGLAQRLAQRRTTMDEAETLIADFAAHHDAPAQVALFLAIFEQIQDARNKVMAGIARYAHHQTEMDAQINDLRHRLETLNAAQPQDFDAIDKAEADLDWSTRIFQDRQQSLTYVCETPVVLEQRAFALAKAVAAHLPK